VLSDPSSDDGGSALILMPAAMLVVIILGAIAVDLSVVHLARRELSAGAAGAANDAVTYGLDESALRTDGSYELDAGRVEEAVRQSLAGSDVGDEVDEVAVTQLGVDQVQVTLSMSVDYLFARGIPGGPDRTEVTASATATVVRR
jgi:Flp pilus assembly protein TadG